MAPPQAKKTSIKSKYAHVKTAHDLLVMGVKPKSSSQNMALLVQARLAGLKKQVEFELTDTLLGSWLPAINVTGTEYTGVITDAKIVALAQPGMKVILQKDVDDQKTIGLEGIITATYASSSKFDVNVKLPNNVIYHTMVDAGMVHVALAKDQKIVTEITKYELSNIVVYGNDALSSRVIFSHIPKKATISAVVGKQSRATNITIPEGAKGTIVKYDYEKSGTGGNSIVSIEMDDKIEGSTLLTFKISEIYSHLYASSLGSEEPKDKKKAVREETFRRFFPRTVIPTKRSERLLTGLLMGKADFGFYGPAGGGKSQIVKDLMSIARLQEVLPVVEGCTVNCHPFSLTNSAFAEICPACENCMDKHSNGAYSRTGFFEVVDPKSVKVQMKSYSLGVNISMIQGGVGLQPMHLTGFKIPKLTDDGTAASTSDESSMKDFQPGALPRGNNGIAVLEEMDKIRMPVLDTTLLALSENYVSPEQLRNPVPTNILLFATMNNHADVSDPLNDRLWLLAMRHPSEKHVVDKIMAKAVHGRTSNLDTIEIPDIHTLDAIEILNIILPKPYELTINGFYHAFREGFLNEKKRDVQVSNRSLIDAHYASRAKFFLEQIMGMTDSHIVTEDYVKFGMQIAMCTRVNIANRDEEQAYKEVLVKEIQNKWPELLKANENMFWCSARQYFAVGARKNPLLLDNLITEWKLYTTDVQSADDVFQRVKDARNGKADIAVCATYPFMDYLFDQQPGMERITNPQTLTQLMTYYLASGKSSTPAFPLKQ